MKKINLVDLLFMTVSRELSTKKTDIVLIYNATAKKYLFKINDVIVAGYDSKERLLVIK